MAGTTSDAMTGDPVVSFNFEIDIQGIITGFFSSVSGLGGSTEVTEQLIVGASGVQIVRKIPGRFEGAEITLKRAITANMDAWAWRKMIVDGNISEARKNGTIKMLDQAGDPVAQWDFTMAWPSKIDVDSADSGSSSVMQETITVVYEELTRTL